MAYGSSSSLLGTHAAADIRLRFYLEAETKLLLQLLVDVLLVEERLQTICQASQP